jgi:hypothetical protein
MKRSKARWVVQKPEEIVAYCVFGKAKAEEGRRLRPATANFAIEHRRPFSSGTTADTAVSGFG